jgi:hypothetical protein
VGCGGWGGMVAVAASPRDSILPFSKKLKNRGEGWADKTGFRREHGITRQLIRGPRVFLNENDY